MTLSNITKRVASYINRLNDAGEPLDRDVTTSDIHNWINDRYLEDIFPEFVESRSGQQFYSRESTLPNYQVNGVVSSTSTGSTLTATTGIFSNSMIGTTVKNENDDDTRIITGFTDDFSVTVDEAIDDDWDGDTIKVYSGLFNEGGDALGDMYRVDWIGVKYATTDNDWIKCNLMTDRDAFKDQRGTDKNGQFSELSPVYIPDTVWFGDEPDSIAYSGFKILPTPTVSNETGIFVKYIERPSKLVNDSDEPRLPLGHHKILIYGATADALLKMEKYDQAERWEARYMAALARLKKYNMAEREKRTVGLNLLEDFKNRTI